MRLIDPVKTAYDRLYRKNIKVSRDQIRAAFEDLEMDDANSNSEQIDCVVQHLLETQNQIVLQTQEKIVDLINDQTHLEDFPIDYEDDGVKDLPSTQLEKPEGSIVLTQNQKIALVQEQSAVLGLQLNNDQIHTTASRMVSVYTSFEESIEDVKSLVIQVLNQQRNKAEEKLINSLNEIADTASQGFESLSERSSLGFGMIMDQLSSQETDFKSRTGSLKDQLRQLLT